MTTSSATRDYAGDVVASRAAFDARSGGILERFIFNNRLVIISICAFITICLAYQATSLDINVSFERMMPQSHPFIRNYQANADSLRGLGNSVRIVVENAEGDIYDRRYLEVLRDINDKVFLIPGVDRSFMKSLWMPVVRWTEITDEGYKGGSVMPDTYDGSPESILELRGNVQRAGIIGSIVSNDQRSSMLFVPLLEQYGANEEQLDYAAFHNAVNAIRTQYEAEGVRVFVIGFAQLGGDLIHGMREVFAYFLVAAVICTVLIFLYTRCVRSTLLVVSCSVVAVGWQLGLMRLLGFVLDPYSVLVPFLIFAIGVSHGAQKMNGIMQDIGRGIDRYVAARYTFRRLFFAGLTALLADAVGFAVLAVVDIPVIRALAFTASIGVAILIFTNLILLPVLLSYTGVGGAAAKRALKSLEGEHPLVRHLSRFSKRSWATVVLAVAGCLFVVGVVTSGGLRIGDLDPGAPELRVDSTYNRDNAYIMAHYELSSDQFAVIVTTPEPDGLVNYEVILEMDRLEQMLRELPGVQTTVSLGSLTRRYTAAGFEGSPKWVTINRDTYVTADAINYVAPSNPELINGERSVASVVVFLSDHKAETLNRVVEAVETFAEKHSTPRYQFLLAAGTSGIEAATNIAVAQSNRVMLLYVYCAVVLLCYVTFRSWRAVVVAILPLVLTSILCEALMVALGIGVKVATLPVTALGVGIGVDYSLYLLTVFLVYQRRGMSVREAYSQSLAFTGKVVALIGVSLATAVATWAWSPIKFQANMGILLAFMFIWNMLGALVLVPSLAAFLLQPRVPRAADAGVVGKLADA